ncbi:MAG: antibiotic biosynthesis monooxygenase [Fibrobacterota bacterium]|nr:antibiotic biosynthesis monooxygenase [Fibrobacterota bacterium]QQS04254.1 MAG: antibiotic biosynthesis monooxygenase [Fibrobacterota bacterium]
MLIVHVNVHVKPGSENAFLNATVENARESLKEPGIARFDVVRGVEDPSFFVLVEAYRDDQAPAAHKETAHYKTWRDRVEPMMAVARSSVKFREVHPEAGAW